MKSIEYGVRGMKSKKAVMHGKQTPTAEQSGKPIQGVEGAMYVNGKAMSQNATFKKLR